MSFRLFNRETSRGPSLFYAIGITFTLATFPFIAAGVLVGYEIVKFFDETKSKMKQKEIKDIKIQENEDEEEGFTCIHFEDSQKCEYTGVPMNFLCSITHDLMEDPVIIETGMTYEKSAIQEWFHKNNTCPLTGLEVKSKKLQVNHSLKSSIEDWKLKNSKNDF